jgi:hypothetical protein
MSKQESVESTQPRGEVSTGHLYMPDRLQGNQVLEVYSGNEQTRLKTYIEDSGGRYISLDIGIWSDMDNHVRADVGKMPFSDYSFDYVVMVGPPFWGRNVRFIDRITGKSHRLVDDMFDSPMKEIMRVLSNKPGSSISVFEGFSLKDISYFKKWLMREPELIGTFDIHYNLIKPTLDVYRGIKLLQNTLYSLGLIRKVQG